MNFDETNPEERRERLERLRMEGVSSGKKRRRSHTSRHYSERDSESHRRSERREESMPRRRRTSSENGLRERERVQDFPTPALPSSSKGYVAWLWVLGLLVAATLVFAWYLHKERTVARILPGEAPTTLLLPYIDPILAPLETGESGYSVGTLHDLKKRFQTDQESVNLDEKDIFRNAVVAVDILTEAIEDRSQHLGKISKLESEHGNVSDIQRRHYEAAIEVSWQRNSGAYRNRLEELWLRQKNMERGRFRSLPSQEAVPIEENLESNE